MLVDIAEPIFKAVGFRPTITIEDRETRTIRSYDPVGSPEWFEWLDRKSTRVFKIDEQDPYDDGEICEAQKDQSGNWYVTAELHGQHYQVYIGPSKEMTAENMITAMEQLYKLPYQKK